MNPLRMVSTSLVQPAGGTNSTGKIKGAAQQFESLMISELLKTAREAGSDGGWLGTGDEDEPGQTSLDMAEQQLANVMSKAGGLGMQQFIVQRLGAAAERSQGK